MTRTKADHSGWTCLAGEIQKASGSPTRPGHSRGTDEGCTAAWSGPPGDLQPTRPALRSWGHSARTLHPLKLKTTTSSQSQNQRDTVGSQDVLLWLYIHFTPYPHRPHDRYCHHHFIHEELKLTGFENFSLLRQIRVTIPLSWGSWED